MSAADLGRPPHALGTAGLSVGTRMAMRRASVLVLTAALTGAGAYEMYMVVQVGGVTIMEGMVLVLFVALLAWIAFSFASALAGFFVLLRREGNALPIRDDGPLPQLASRTAVLLPTYNENPHQLMARLRAILESVEATGQAERFDWFVLSDTRDPDIWIAEEQAFLELLRSLRHRAAVLPASPRQYRAEVRQYRRVDHAVRRRLPVHDRARRRQPDVAAIPWCGWFMPWRAIRRRR